APPRTVNASTNWSSKTTAKAQQASIPRLPPFCSTHYWRAAPPGPIDSLTAFIRIAYECRRRAAMELDLKALRCFAAVAEELNFSRAAVRLNLSQPALSCQMRTLARPL